MKTKYKNKMMGDDDISNKSNGLEVLDIEHLLKDIDLDSFTTPMPPVKEPKKQGGDTVVYQCLSCGRYKVETSKPFGCICHNPLYVIDLTKRA